jgi:RES domain-containing protein
LKAVVDLCDPKVQMILQTNSAEIVMNFRSITSGSAPTQLLGERCLASGRIDGLLFDSPAMPGKTNLAVFEAALAVLGSSLAVNDPSNNLLDSLP